MKNSEHEKRLEAACRIAQAHRVTISEVLMHLERMEYMSEKEFGQLTREDIIEPDAEDVEVESFPPYADKK